MSGKKNVWRPLTPYALDALIAQDAAAHPPSKRSVRLAKKTIPARKEYNWMNGEVVLVPATKPSRKPRKKKQVRNNWPLNHLLSEKFLCAGCGNGTRFAALQRNGRIMRFRPENPSLVTIQIMTLKRLGFSYDLIYHIMFFVHSPDLVKNEMFIDQQVVFDCSCRYHASCFQKRFDRRTRCLGGGRSILCRNRAKCIMIRFRF